MADKRYINIRIKKLSLTYIFSKKLIGFTGDGFLSNAIVNAVFTFANWFAPPMVSFLGPKITLIGN